jgi:hypothetical protein
VGDGSADGRLDGGGQDGRLDVLGPDSKIDVRAPDTGAEVATSDTRIEVATPDARIEVATPDARIEVATPDARIEVATSDVRSEAGGLDVRDGAPTEGGRPEVATPTDARDTGGDAAPTLSSIEIAPPSPTLATATTLPVAITAVYSDGSTKDVSSLSTVTSSSSAYVTVSGTTLTGVHPGTAIITATYQGKTATATVTVLDTTLQSIVIQAVAPLPIGQTVSLVATGVFADGSKQDVTSQATWSSSSTAIATVGNTSTSKGRVTGVAAGTVTVTATIQAVSGTLQISVVAKKIASIAITPTQPILQRGVTQPFKATALYDDNSTGDLTQQAIWSTGDTGVLSVVATGANAGLATAQAAGTTSITAAMSGINGTTSVTVTAPTLTSIVVSPAAATLFVGNTSQFKAQGTYSDLSTADLTDSVTWVAGTPTIVSVSNATGTRGLVTALAVGNTRVVASLSGVMGMATVTVSAASLVGIAVTPDPLNLPLGLSLPLKATATYGDQTTQDVTTAATWTVGDSSIATVGNLGTAAGQVTGKAVGTTSVTAALSGFAAQVKVIVANPNLLSISVAPAAATITAGQPQAFAATGSYDNSTSVDITTQVTWSSNNTAVAQVSNAAGSNGVATSLIAGTATITAALSGVRGRAGLTVGQPALVSIVVTPATATIAVGATQGYTVRAVYANGTTGNLTGANWSSSSVGVATITAGGGGGGGATARGVAAGTTTITATYTSGSNSFSDTATLTVTAPRTLVGIRLSPATATIRVNGSQAYTVDGDYSDGTTTPIAAGVTLTTSNGTVAAVAGGGRGGPVGLLVNGVGAGTATVTATYTASGQTFTDTATITVEAPKQVGLFITPASAVVRVGVSQQFSAMAIWDDGTSTDVTGSASWTTSDGKLATITSAVGGRGGGGGGGGLATGVGPGTVTVNATYSGFSATATLTVTAPVLKSLVIIPANSTIQVDLTQSFVATAVYDNGTSVPVTGSATWRSSDETVAVMSVAGGGRGGVPGGGVVGGGTATGVAVGSATISATYTENGITVTGTATLTVNDPPLLSLEITPTNPTVTLDSQYQLFVATAIYKDASTRNVTAAATWSSSAGTVAVISSSGATAGRATLLAPGTSTITATYQGVSGTTVLAVSGAKLTSLAIAPSPLSVAVGGHQQLTATGTWDDKTTRDITNNVTWLASSGDASGDAIATVSNAAGSRGLFTAVSAGSVTVTAVFQFQGAIVTGTLLGTVTASP